MTLWAEVKERSKRRDIYEAESSEDVLRVTVEELAVARKRVTVCSGIG